MNGQTADQLRCKQAEDAVFRETEDGTMILIPEDGTVHLLDDVGSRIWELCAEPVSAAQVTDVIHSEYDVDQVEARKDVDGFLRQLLELGVLVEVL